MLLTCVRVFVVTLLLATLAFADGWKDCKLSSGRVDFPEKPGYRLSTDASPVGTLTTHNWEYRSLDVSLTANTVKLPNVALIFAGPQEIYADAARALVQDAGASQLGYQELTIGGLPAAQVTYRMADGGTGRARFVLVNDTLLTTVATWRGSEPQQVDRFLGSLATR